MGLIESYDAAIVSLEREVADCECRAKTHQERAAIEHERAALELARATEIRVTIQAMREPRDELAILYPPEQKG